MNLPHQVTICEVAPRDGFQAEPKWIPTEDKVEMIRALAMTGVSQIEVTSFVHPKAIPQLRDAFEVATQVQDLPGITLRALVPNVVGAKRAIDAGIHKLKLMLSATDSHSLANANCKVEEALEKLDPVFDLAAQNNITVSGSISVAFGCPYEGVVPIDQLIRIITRYQERGVNEISLADTTGMANPKQIYEDLEIFNQEFPHLRFSLHLHNTRGLALANAFAALQQGVTHFDASVAGLGGCPYAPGATGNVATEDLVYAFEEMGIHTGIHIESLLSIARRVQKQFLQNGESFLLRAGTCSQLHSKPDHQEKLID
ncbi:hydroxymethylglutaryl-CoA lyase [Sulfoacidibacillus thermotolerans]|uniref:hydroxymethylglutaryl-CoA lyase n=1 Tax=Sulfoacidibacillus thermotolerans TaxID=1765684 RepID=A0A2U3D607_SULT2|nr:hydroxymethylglutaryl-CoA lyase [Sulfoacidibacillus thermotolerans]PWI56704.1 hydroxymethylglutaryl-CoA lyase [Sulfoacidibacillus thermotolerans]